MKAIELRKSLEGVPDDAEVLFQGNIFNDEDEENGSPVPTYTTCLGTVYEAWLREPQNEFVLDCAITNQE